MVARARQEASAAQLDAAAARADQQAANEAATRERNTVEELRREFTQERQRLQAELDAARQAGQEASDQTAAVRLELAASQADAAAAQRAAQADREAIAALRREVEQVRGDARSEREALRAAQTEQLAQIQHSADERASALNQALTLARETAEMYRAQLDQARPPARRESEPRTTARKRTP